MRALLFNLVYWLLSLVYVALAAVCLLAPGRKSVAWVVRRYSRRMVLAMRLIAGIRLKVVGRSQVPDGDRNPNRPADRRGAGAGALSVRARIGSVPDVVDAAAGAA